jgi:hypothetical protein
LRSAWLIRRACRPGRLSPISPSISARGVSAATESMTSTSMAPERTSVSVISSACSPVSGCEISRFVEIDAELAGIDRIERMFGIDEGADAALLLGFGNGLQRQRRLARAFRPVDLDDAAPRQAADAERDIEPERARRNRLDLDDALVLPSFMIEPLPNERSIWESAAVPGSRNRAAAVSMQRAISPDWASTSR